MRFISRCSRGPWWVIGASVEGLSAAERAAPR
jgi:hypothetical protein